MKNSKVNFQHLDAEIQYEVETFDPHKSLGMYINMRSYEFCSILETWCPLNVNHKHPSCKNSTQVLKNLVEKDVKSNGQPRPPAFDRFKSFGHDELTAKHFYFRCSRSPDVDGSKFLIKMARLQNIFYLNALRPGHLYQNFWSHQHQEALSTWNNNVLQWGHHDQTFKSIKSRRPWRPLLPIWFHIFFNNSFSIWLLFFYTWGVSSLQFIFLENCISYVKDKYSHLIRLLVVTSYMSLCFNLIL